MSARLNGRGDTWRLLPWQHLASAFVPVAVMAAALIIGVQGADSAEVADPFDGMEDTGAPAGLALVISSEGYAVVWSDAEGEPGARDRGVAVPCDLRCSAPGDWDVAGLVQQLQRIKAAHPDADTLTIYPAADVPYRALIDTLDAARAGDADQPLFPFAVVSSERR